MWGGLNDVLLREEYSGLLHLLDLPHTETGVNQLTRDRDIKAWARGLERSFKETRLFQP